MGKSLQGQLLVASPRLTDPNFYHSIVLILQHDEDGALGLVLNRPLKATMAQIWKQVGEAPHLKDVPLYCGGPCEGALIVLHQRPDASQGKVISQVYFSTTAESVYKLVEEQTAPLLFFAGSSGWSPGQLEAELGAAAWLTLPATPDNVFRPAADPWLSLHRLIVQQLIAPQLKPWAIPDDPRWN